MKTLAKTTLAATVISTFPLLIAGCSGSSVLTAGLSSSGAIVVTHTLPASNVVSQSATTTFHWTLSGAGAVRTTNPYQVKVYSQAACAGTALSTSFVSTAQYDLTGLKDSEVKSIGVTAFNTSDTASTESCSNSVTGNAFISQVQIAGGSYLSLDVDFTNSLAYLGSAYATSFFDAYDFSDEANPVKIKTVGSATTPSSLSATSRGIALYNNGQRLLVASDGSGKLELWDLTSNSRTGTWVKLSELAGLTKARKIAKVDTSNPVQTVVYVALRYGIAIVNIAEPAGTMTLSKSNGGLAESGCGAILGSWMLAGANNNLVASLIDTSLATPAVNSTYSIPTSSTGSVLWTASTSTAGNKAFVGGQNGAFFTFDPLNPTVVPTMTYRFADPTSSVARDSIFTVENGKELLYTASQHKINVWDTTSTVAPIMTGQLSLLFAAGESYGVRVNPTTHRAYIGTGSGWFMVINTDMIPAPVTANLPVVY